MAKIAVAQHRAESRTVSEWNRAHDLMLRRAKWIARSTVLTNNLPDPPFMDSEASRSKADKLTQMKAAGGTEAKWVRRKWIQRTPELGGHALVATEKNGTRSGWRCSVCRKQGANHTKMATQQCEGSAAGRWATKAVQLAEAGISVGKGHTRV